MSKAVFRLDGFEYVATESYYSLNSSAACQEPPLVRGPWPLFWPGRWLTFDFYKNIARNQDKAGFLCAFNYSSWNLNNCLSFCRTTAQCVVPISGRYNTGGLTCSPLRPLCLCVKTPQTGAHFWTQGIVLSYHTDCRVTRCGDWSCHQVWQSTPAVKRLFLALANPIENISSSDSVFMLLTCSQTL